jgi:hypothetical protein
MRSADTYQNPDTTNDQYSRQSSPIIRPLPLLRVVTSTHSRIRTSPHLWLVATDSVEEVKVDGSEEQKGTKLQDQSRKEDL